MPETVREIHTLLLPWAQVVVDLAWPILALYALIRFRSYFEAILGAFAKRVDKASKIKIGNFEMSDAEPQSVAEQRENIVEDIKHLRPNNTASFTVPNAGNALARYVLAEDLAIRALQNEFQTVIQRQVKVGARHSFDAIFVHNGNLNVVEVCLFRDRLPLDKIRADIRRFEDFSSKRTADNVKLILVLVTEGNNDMSDTDTRKILDLIVQTSGRASIKRYSLEWLMEEFGVQS